MARIVVLEAVFSNSDIRTDYFDSDHRLERWPVCPVEGKAVTEAKLRRALSKLPAWLRRLSWTYRKGEKYSMSDHYYGQLRVEAIGVKTRNDWGYEAGVGLILETSTVGIYTMNDRLDKPLPQSIDEIGALALAHANTLKH